jgi:hypothetical protein
MAGLLCRPDTMCAVAGFSIRARVAAAPAMLWTCLI